jgi:Rrf2 family protein
MSSKSIEEIGMNISQKCQYAVRAIFELSRHYGEGPLKIAEIAEAEAIPLRFLETILGELKKGGFAESRRGAEGGYILAASPRSIRLGDVIRFVDGPLGPVEESGGQKTGEGRAAADKVLARVWDEAHEALSEVFYGKTFADLVDEYRRMQDQYVPRYTI